MLGCTHRRCIDGSHCLCLRPSGRAPAIGTNNAALAIGDAAQNDEGAEAVRPPRPAWEMRTVPKVELARVMCCAALTGCVDVRRSKRVAKEGERGSQVEQSLSRGVPLSALAHANPCSRNTAPLWRRSTTRTATGQHTCTTTTLLIPPSPSLSTFFLLF